MEWSVVVNKLVNDASNSNNEHVILTSLAGERQLFYLNILTGAYSKSSISNKDQSANGYSETYKIDGKIKIAAIFSFNESLALFYDKPIMLNQKGLKASIKSGGFFKSRFELKLNDEVILDFKYWSPDVQTDVFYDIVDYLKIEPFDKRVKEMHEMSQYFLVEDKAKRLELVYRNI